MRNDLLCPQCLKENLLRSEASQLKCTQCDITFLQNSSTFFFDFRSQSPNQDIGLLAEQEIDFYTNGIFKKFVRENTSRGYRKIIKLLKPGTILDIGCGNGSLAGSLSGLFSSYIGYEPSDLPNGEGYPFSHLDNISLFHNDTDKKLPVRDQTLDLVLFMASYDHIPHPEKIVRDAWTKLRSGGHLMIVMSNYSFWVKSILNFLGGKQLFKHNHEHFCVHTPESLTKEILNFIPEAHLENVDADDLYIPNLPKVFSFFYFKNWWLCALNNVLKFTFNFILRLKHRGSTMTLVFKK